MIAFQTIEVPACYFQNYRINPADWETDVNSWQRR